MRLKKGKNKESEGIERNRWQQGCKGKRIKWNTEIKMAKLHVVCSFRYISDIGTNQVFRRSYGSFSDMAEP